MAELRIESATEGNLRNTQQDYSVDPQTTDGINDENETTWTNSNWTQQLGYYKKIGSLKKAINAVCAWTIGKGYKASPTTKIHLDGISGFGKDTFNTILENMMRVMLIGGDSFAQIIRGKRGKLENELINIKPLDPSSMVIVLDENGIIKRYEQISKIKGKNPRKFKPEEIFHLCRNRVADEIHGESVIDAMKDNILSREESLHDYKEVQHRHVKPLVKFILDTDDETEISNFKEKADKTIADGENLYLPKGTAEHEILSVPPNSTLSPLAWQDNLKKSFYEEVGVPQIVVGGSGEFTEASAKISYLAWQQTIEEEQLFIEEQVGIQLGLLIELEFPASLENELLSDNKKDGRQDIKASETTAGEGQ